MRHRTASKRLLLAAGAAFALVAVAGCSASNSTSKDTGTSAAGGATSQDLSVVIVSGPLDDPYFGAMKRGADDAAAQLGIKVQYLSPSSTKEGSGPTLARLIRDGMNTKPDAMVISNFFPDAEDPLIKEATGAGMPVTIINGGVDSWEKDGALTYVGLDAAPIGSSVAKGMADLGVKNAMCVNTVPGNPFLESVCKGLVDGMTSAGNKGKTITIPYADSSDPTKSTAQVAGALKADPTIDGVFAFGNVDFVEKAAEQAGAKVQIGTGALSTQTLKDISAGKIAFALDSQPYLQSYYGILSVVQYARYGLMPRPIMTGPSVITKDTAAKVLDFNEKSKGIRGAA